MKHPEHIPAFLIALLALASPLRAQPAEADTASAHGERLLSLDVKDTDLRDVIRMISKGYNLNIILDQDVKGKVTLHLTDVPIMEGLRKIAESNGLDVVQDGSVYKIRKAAEHYNSTVRYVDGKLTVDVQNMEVKAFLKELSAKTAVSIVPDAKVEGRLTGKLFEVSLDDGLRAMLEGNGFKVAKRRNIYQVSPGESAADASGPPRMRAAGSGQAKDFYVDYTNGLITLNVTSGDLEDIVRAISEQGDVEIITYGSIKSEVNARINRAPITEALALLLGGTRYTFVQRGNVILIGDRNTSTPSGQTLSKSELIHLRHIKADNIPSILPKDIPSSNVRVIKEQNALLISGTSEDIVTAREFLRTIDIPTPQVRIDAVIVEYKENLDRETGIRYGKREKGTIEGSYFINPAPATRMSDESANTEIGISGKTMRNILIESIPKKETVIKDLISEDFFITLQFLEDQNKAKVLAQPSIMTLNGNKASIDVSETQYFKVTTGTADNYTIRFQPIKFGIQLDIVPWISQSGQITAEITPVISNSDKTNVEGYPNVSSRSLTTTVRLNDGETLILGGLIRDQESQFRYKVPILGSIPLLGALFRHSGATKSKSNLVVYITPTIVTQEQVVDLDDELERFNMRQKNFFKGGKADAKKSAAKQSEEEHTDAADSSETKTLTEPEPAAETADTSETAAPPETAESAAPPEGSAGGGGSAEGRAADEDN